MTCLAASPRASLRTSPAPIPIEIQMLESNLPPDDTERGVGDVARGNEPDGQAPVSQSQWRGGLKGSGWPKRQNFGRLGARLLHAAGPCPGALYRPLHMHFARHHKWFLVPLVPYVAICAAWGGPAVRAGLAVPTRRLITVNGPRPGYLSAAACLTGPRTRGNGPRVLVRCGTTRNQTR